MDLTTFSNLVQSNRKDLVNAAFRVVGNWDVAEDVVQKTLSYLETKIHTFKDDGPAKPMTWITTAVIRRAINELRNQRRRLERILSGEATSVDPLTILNTEWIEREKSIIFELIKSWLAALEQTNPKTAKIIRLYYLEGRPMAFVAKETGLSENACKLRALYIRRRWKKMIILMYKGRGLEDTLQEVLNA
jgi:RNA polymerase sigma factor (sigma-70 family)